MVNYPPYPRDWIILEEEDTNEVIDPLEIYPDEPLEQRHYKHRHIKACKLFEDSVSIFYATMWLLPPDMNNGRGWEDNIDPEMGASLTRHQMYEILNKLASVAK